METARISISLQIPQPFHSNLRATESVYKLFPPLLDFFSYIHTEDHKQVKNFGADLLNKITQKNTAI